MMKNRSLGLSLAVLSLLSVGATANANDREFRARLAGFQEVPSLSTTGRGSFSAQLSEDGSTLSFSLTYSDLQSATSVAHIHFAQKSVNGGVAVFLCGGPRPACPPSGTVTGDITAADVGGPAGQGIAVGEFAELVRALRSGNTYVNVHSSTFPAGEIRGQIKGQEEE